jgi:N-acyl homoserine lactone hydrolase
MNLLTFRTTTHQTTPAGIGTPVSSSAMEALIDQPGPIELKTIGSSWAAPLSGLLNLKDPQAVQAGLTNHKEPIQIYLHVVRHPTQGFFLIDTGVAEQFVKDPAAVGVGGSSGNTGASNRWKVNRVRRLSSQRKELP